MSWLKAADKTQEEQEDGRLGDLFVSIYRDSKITKNPDALSRILHMCLNWLV